MIDVKCFTFFTIHKIPTSCITEIIEDKYYPIIKIDDLELTPTIKLTCTNSEINDFDANDLLGGYFTNSFTPIGNEIETTENNIIIKSIFALQFGVDISIFSKGDKIIYIEEDTDYSYKVTPSFCGKLSPPLTSSTDINSEKELIIKEEIKEMII